MSSHVKTGFIKRKKRDRGKKKKEKMKAIFYKVSEYKVGDEII